MTPPDPNHLREILTRFDAALGFPSTKSRPDITRKAYEQAEKELVEATNARLKAELEEILSQFIDGDALVTKTGQASEIISAIQNRITQLQGRKGDSLEAD